MIDLENFCDVWKALKSYYDKVSLSNVDSLSQEYNSIFMHESESVMANVSCLAVIENRMCGIGYNITETDRVRFILRGLRNDFAVTVNINCAMNNICSAAIGLLMNKEGSLKLFSSSHRSGSTGNA